MLLQAAAEHGLDLQASFLVGDRMTDIAAGAAAGCRTVLVTCGRHDAPPIVTVEPLDPACRPDHTCLDLQAAAQWILAAAMKAMVLCAGYGTRLGDLTREIPKPMLPLGDRPMLEYILCHLKRHGFDQVAVNLHFMPEVIQNHFADGARWGVRLTYSHEPQLLGTAGGTKKMAVFLPGR